MKQSALHEGLQFREQGLGMWEGEGFVMVAAGSDGRVGCDMDGLWGDGLTLAGGDVESGERIVGEVVGWVREGKSSIE